MVSLCASTSAAKVKFAELFEERLSESPSGVECIAFIPIDDKWAMKCYQDKVKRDDQHRMQKKAAKYGLGPEVGKKFTIDTSEDRIYGFITEIVDAKIGRSWKHKERYSDDDYHQSWEDIREFTETPMYMDNIQGLRDDLKKIGFTFYDIHGGNVGVKDGKLVCIDFGG